VAAGSVQKSLSDRKGVFSARAIVLLILFAIVMMVLVRMLL